jgi:hypothetical protein
LNHITKPSQAIAIENEKSGQKRSVHLTRSL